MKISSGLTSLRPSRANRVPIVRSYCPPPVVYVPPIVIQRPVYYTQPVVYTQPVQYQQTSYQPVVYQTPVVTRRVVTEESQPIIEETVIVKKAPQVIKKVTTINYAMDVLVKQFHHFRVEIANRFLRHVLSIGLQDNKFYRSALCLWWPNFTLKDARVC